ncbi:Alpha-elicitin MGM-alpha [Phytophthora citrophthora]|uniref:Alpha-elicitin MGM-alpha n=1 Tax=Phytophthora citrophthora TaxID=4793 RepID=A0AAD9G443_9STRA|nr:Alpha-elicitin MGM-alpha [Phytophthora citrophthora]
MNVFSFIAVVTIAFIGSANASGSSSSSGNTTCSTSQQSSAYVTLASLLNLSTFSGCAPDSGYSLTTSTALPTGAEYTKMCSSSNCQSLIKSVISLNPPDCTMTVPTSGLTLNVHSLATGFSAKCSSLSGTSSAMGSSDSSSSTITAPETPTTTTSTTKTPATKIPAATTATSVSLSASTTFAISNLSTIATTLLLCIVAVNVSRN